MLMHLSSLPSGYSIGSLGKYAYRFIDFLSLSGFSYWQLLPLCVTDAHASPYKSRGLYSLNPYFLDLEELYRKGLLTSDELICEYERSPYLVDYDRLYRERLPLLYKAAMRVKERGEISAFINERPRLREVCEFLALSDTYKRPFREWQKDAVPPSDRLFFWQFVHYEFLCEWKRLRTYANSHGVELIGDLPIYPDYESADVFYNPDCFLLDPDMLPRAVSGVPPDSFSESGQLWGNPLYRFEEMAKNGYALWRERVRFAFEMYDAVRIDHFRAFDSFYEIPRESDSARGGKWHTGPGLDFVRALNEWREGRTVIAEDLGSDTYGARRLISEGGLFGMRVIQFGARGDSLHLPHSWDENVFAYTGTHDNNTLLGAIWEMEAYAKERLFDYFNIRHTDPSLAVTDIIKGMLASRARAVIIPVQDLLCFGADTRMNTPGEPFGNWRYRITEDNLDSLLASFGKWKKINLLYDRLGFER